MASLKNIPRNVWVLGFTSLLTDVSSEMIHSVLPLFMVTVLGANVMTIGLIEGIAEATASILKLFSGAISDHWQQRKALVILGYGLSALMKPLFIIANSPLGVFYGRLGDRIGKGIRVAPRDALVADSTDPSNRGAAYGLRQSLDTIGALLGPLLAFGLLGQTHDFQLVFKLALIPAFLGVLLLILGIREPKVPYQSLKRPNPLRWDVLGKLGRGYWGLAIAALLFNLGNSSEAFLLLEGQHVGIPDNQIPLILVAMNLSYALSAYPVGMLSDRLSRKILLTMGWGGAVVVYLGLAVAQTPGAVWGLVVLYGLHLGMTQGVLLAMVADRVPELMRGTAFGFLNLLVGVALLPASLLAGYLWQGVNPGATFLTSGLLSLGAIVLLAFQPEQLSSDRGD
jgi:MFS family permease